MDKLPTLNFDSNTLQIDYLRPIPQIINNEFIWNEIMIMPELQWNYTLEVNFDKLSQVKEIIQKSCDMEVSTEEFNLLCEYLKNDKDLLKNCGFSSQKLPLIIEKNKNIVHFVLLEMCQFPGFEDYLENFIQIDVTQNMMEVFAQLYGEIKIPQNFVTIFVNHCVEFCKNMKERQQKNKLVKFVSIFINQLLKQRAFTLKDILTELHAFCIEFSRITEVSRLFKQIKQVEQQLQ